MSQLLRVEGISKEFPGVKALDGMNFELDRREVLALVGENGAGKSTLMKLLSGIYTPDAGEFFVEGERRSTSPIRRRPGAGHQHHPPGVQPDARPDGRAEHLHRPGAADRFLACASGELNAPAQALIDGPRIRLRPKQVVGELTVRQAADGRDRQGAVLRRAKLLIMDEPTAALNDAEVEVLHA